MKIKHQSPRSNLHHTGLFKRKIIKKFKSANIIELPTKKIKKLSFWQKLKKLIYRLAP